MCRSGDVPRTFRPNQQFNIFTHHLTTPGRPPLVELFWYITPPPVKEAEADETPTQLTCRGR